MKLIAKCNIISKLDARTMNNMKYGNILLFCINIGIGHKCSQLPVIETKG